MKLYKHDPLNNRHIQIIHILVIIIISIIYSCPSNAETILNIKEGDEWRYFTGTTEPDRLWNDRGFDDSAWKSGASSFGYGDGSHNTLLSDMRGNYKSVYVRREFPVTDHTKITRIVISIFCDGPFVAYLNGIEASRSKRRQTGDSLDLTGFAHELDPGQNVIAIQCSNDDIDSNDFFFIPVFEFHEK